MATHLFDGFKFKQLRLKWLFFLMIPSVILDFYFIYIVLEQYPQLVAAGQMQDITWESIKLFLVNAIFLKGACVSWYFTLKFNRSKSYVETSSKKVVFERLTKSQNDLPSFNYFYDTITIVSVSRLKVKRNGSIAVEGEIVSARRESAGGRADTPKRDALGNPVRKRKSRFVIPGYFKDMEAIFKALEKLKTHNGS